MKAWTDLLSRRGFFKGAAAGAAGGAVVVGAQPGVVTAQETSQGTARLASAYPGEDLGAKINAAVASLGGGPGEVWVDQNAGTFIRTPVVVADSTQVLRFVQGGIYLMAAPMDVSHLAGSGFGGVTLVGRAPVVLVQVDGANLPYLVRAAFDAGSVRDIHLVGNKASNPNALDVITTAKRGVFFENLFINTAKRHGIYVKSTTPNSAVGARFSGVCLHQNGEAGLRVEEATDPWVLGGCLFEENGTHGIHLSDAAGARIFHSDFAKNTLPGLYIQGTTGKAGSNQVMVIGNQFGQNYKEDIMIVGHDGNGYVSVANIIGPNQFWGGANRTGNASDSILLLNTMQNVVSGNVFSSAPDTPYRYAIAAISNGFSNTDFWGPNSFVGPFGSGHILPISGLTQLVATITA